MNIGKIIGLGASGIVLITAIGSSVVWGFDTRYVTLAGLQQFSLDQKIQELQNKIDELALKAKLNLASDFEKALLEQHREKLEKLEKLQ